MKISYKQWARIGLVIVLIMISQNFIYGTENGMENYISKMEHIWPICLNIDGNLISFFEWGSVFESAFIYWPFSNIFSDILSIVAFGLSCLTILSMIISFIIVGKDKDLLFLPIVVCIPIWFVLVAVLMFGYFVKWGEIGVFPSWTAFVALVGVIEAQYYWIKHKKKTHLLEDNKSIVGLVREEIMVQYKKEFLTIKKKTMTKTKDLMQANVKSKYEEKSEENQKNNSNKIIFCSECGEKLQLGAIFCKQCGSKVK